MKLFDKKFKFFCWLYLLYYGSAWLWGFRLPIAYLRKCNNILASSDIKTNYKGITIIDFNWGGKSHSSVFFQIAQDALRLIETYDPRRFHRLQQEIKFIVNEVVIGNGEYDRIAKRCSIDFGPFDVDPNRPEYEWHKAQFASFLVYEATHGSLLSRFVPYTRHNRKRIEYLCYREQKSFACRLPSTQFDFCRDLVPSLNEQMLDSQVAIHVGKRLQTYLSKTWANFANRKNY